MTAVTRNPWEALRAYTSARIALGRAGASLPTAPLLEFQQAHARARDAVHLAFDAAAIAAALRATGRAVLEVNSAAPDRHIYLRRPDLGRRLDAAGRELLAAQRGNFDCAFVIGDGLSALAVHAHALPVLRSTAAALEGQGWRIAPVAVARQARVALGDEIGELLGAGQVAVLIGERPGLSSADSLGIYLTYGPRVGRSDAERNCISNIRPEGGLGYVAAAHKLVWLMGEARRRQLSGVALKDEADGTPLLVEDTGERT